jgi:hypothetical protein
MKTLSVFALLIATALVSGGIHSVAGAAEVTLLSRLALTPEQRWSSGGIGEGAGYVVANRTSLPVHESMLNICRSAQLGSGCLDSTVRR